MAEPPQRHPGHHREPRRVHHGRALLPPCRTSRDPVAKCGWHVTPSWTHTIRVDGYGGGTLILPSIRVTDIGASEFDGIDHADDIDWSEKGTVVLRHARCRIDPEP